MAEMPIAEVSIRYMPGVDVDHVPPVTRESFITAYVDAHPSARCSDAFVTWDMLHGRALLRGEIDEDPS